jgi:hypothetical protein
MAEITEDLSNKQVIENIEKNFIEGVKYWGKLPKSVIEHDSEIIRMTTGVPVADLNFITSIGPVTGNIDQKIEETILFFESTRMPCLWWVFPGAASPDLTDRLKSHGFTLRASVPCMIADLSKISRTLGLQQGVTTQIVRTNEELKMWAETSAAGLELPEFLKEAYIQFIMTFPVDDISRQILFLGCHDGKPATTSLLFLDAGIAEINLVSKSYRKVW